MTTAQLDALTRESGWILYLRDRAIRDYAFVKVDKERLANADLTEPPDPVTVKARNRFLASYGLPEMRGQELTRRTAQDFVKAVKKKRVPNWVLAAAPPYAEIEALAKS